MTTPEEQAAVDAAQEKQLRDLASQITQMSKLGFDPMTVRKGIIGAVDDGASPPTVSLNISGDTETLVTQVRTLNNYTPLVGQTVLIGKQGTEIFLIGAISAASPYNKTAADNGWTLATLSFGSHNGNSNGSVYYRRVLEHGAWKMQWQGGWTTSGNTTMIASGQALGSDFRPGSKRSLVIAREVQGGSTSVGIDFNTDGTVALAGPTETADSATVSVSGTTGGATTSSYVEHSHGGAVAISGITHNDGSHSHSWSDSASHTHTINHPVWVSLNGVEYFL